MDDLQPIDAQAGTAPVPAPVPAPPQFDLDKLLKDYFARKTGKELASGLMLKVDDYHKHLQGIGRTAIIKRLYEYYYRGEQVGAKVRTGGKQGEYKKMHGNHFRNILQHVLVQATSNRPAFEPKAANTDHKSQAQCILARGVLDYYDRDKGMETQTGRAAELALVFLESFVFTGWDATAGEDYGVNQLTGQAAKQGDVEIGVYGPLDVAYDVNDPNAYKRNWIIVRDFVNKYDLAAKFPAYAEDILAAKMNDSDLRCKRLGYWSVVDKDNDIIPLFRFFHKKSAVLPQGKETWFINSDFTLIDGDLVYKNFPVERMVAGDQDGTPFGYSISLDLLPLQIVLDTLYSTVVTNQTTFGVQNIAMPKNANVSVKQLAEGMNLIEYDFKGALGLKPEGLSLLKTPAEIFEFMQKLEGLMETIGGVNSVVRGNPEASLKSGAALALVAAQSVQFNNGFQQSYYTLRANTGTNVVETLKKFATTKRMALIAGKSNRSYLKEFSGADLEPINRVLVEISNPLSRTTAGKLQIADTLLEKGWIESPAQYLMVMQTGKLEPLIESKQAQLMLIRSENERLSDGQQTPVLITDDHKLHIIEHQCVLASPEARENPESVSATLAHLQMHFNALQTTDPAILAMLQQPSLMPQTPQLPTNAAGATVPGAGNSPADVVDSTDPQIAAAQNVNQPSQPTNPQTGQPFDPQAGQ